MKKKTCENLSFAVWVIVILFLFSLSLFGCQQQNTTKVWGMGDLDPNHAKFFGNSNLSRLCFVQTNTINRQGQLLAELALRISNLEDPNGNEKQ